ncbi:MAG: hypothetical protein IKJ36_01465 [Clostridia bacterium]|nr:hypothetical protein [Clostridia bacterium]
MGFFDRIKAAFRKIKNKIIVYTILVFIIILWLVTPLCTAIRAAEIASGVTFATSPFDGPLWATFLTSFGTGIVAPWKEIPKCFSETHFPLFWDMLKVTFVVYIFFILVGLSKAFPKHEYEDIENGSSDWCENGEQYKVLSKNKGIVLAEKNYLPLDKRGNVNVLVVRRFWCW